VLSEKHRQGQTVHLRKVVASCRLPWDFRVGKRPNGRAVRAPLAGGTVPPQTGDENPCEQRPVTDDTSAPRPCVEAVQRAPRGNSQEPLLQPAPASRSEGDSQVIPISYSQTCIRQHKRRWDVADLDDRDAQTATGGRQVRPRLDPMDNVETRNDISNARANPSRPHPAAALTGHEANPALRDPNPSDGPSAFPTPLITSLGPLPLPHPESDPEPTLERSNDHTTHSQQRTGPDTRESGATPEADELGTTLQATNPDNGPVTGGIRIWLSVLNPPTNFPCL
jgi:hypothetical protein